MHYVLHTIDPRSHPGQRGIGRHSQARVPRYDGDHAAGSDAAVDQDGVSMDSWGSPKQLAC